MQIVTSAVRGCRPSLTFPKMVLPFCFHQIYLSVVHWCFTSTLMNRVSVLLEHVLCPSRRGSTSFDGFQQPDAFEISLLPSLHCQTWHVFARNPKASDFELNAVDRLGIGIRFWNLLWCGQRRLADLEDVGLAYEEICHQRWFEEEPNLALGFWNFCHEAYQSTPYSGYRKVRAIEIHGAVKGSSVPNRAARTSTGHPKISSLSRTRHTAFGAPCTCVRNTRLSQDPTCRCSVMKRTSPRPAVLPS